jgi:hypothetical protein
MYDIRIIKGDDVFIELELSNIDISLIDYIKFTCKGLNLEVEPSFNSNKIILFFTKHITEELNVGVYDYDIKAYMLDGSEITIIYRAPVRVYDKVN